MKFSTLFAASLLLCSVSVVPVQASSAQGDLKFDNVIMKGYSQVATPMAITSEGNVVVTSTQISGQSLSSFVAMSSPELTNTPIWKVDIKGGSIVHAIIADNEGGAYIGGDFNEKITLGGITLTGKKSENAEKTNAFVAHINKEGKVLAAYAFVSTPNAEMVEKFDTYSQGDKVYCKLNSLAFADGKLYAGLIFTDVLSNAAGDAKVTSGTWNMSGWGMGVGSDADFAAVELDAETMQAKSFPVVFGGKGNYTDSSYMGIDAKSAKMASDGSNLYIVASVNGYYSKAVLQVNGEVKDEPSFSYAGGINAFYVASVNLSNNTTAAKVYDGKYGWVSGASSLVEPGVASLTVKGDDLHIAGSFIQNFPFDTNVKAVGNTDIFFTSLKKNDLSVEKALASGYDEKAAGDDNDEKFSGYAVHGNQLSVYGAVVSRPDVYSPFTLSTPLCFTADLATATSLEAGSAEQYTTGIVQTADGKYTYSSLLSADQTSVAYQFTADETTSIKNLAVEKLNKNTGAYNLQGMKLRAPQKGLNIFNGKKVIIK
uniref:hypothetical protein n=1 Tax=Prevotella sp. TaxID=59823 RepID=UPI0040271FBC